MNKQRHFSYKRKRDHSGFDQELSRWKRQTSFHVDPIISSARYDTHAFLSTLIFAGMTNSSLNATCKLLRAGNQEVPSQETLLRTLHNTDPATMETFTNQLLRNQYQALTSNHRRLFQRQGLIAIDFHTDPYYGDENTDFTVKGKKKASTHQFFSYLTADVIYGSFRQTIAVQIRQKKTSTLDMVCDLLTVVEFVLTPKMILMDGEFAVVDLCRFLIKKGYDFIARKSMSPRIKKRVEQDAHFQNSIFEVFQEVEYLNKQRSQTIRLPTFVHPDFVHTKALIVSPQCSLSVQDAIKLYEKRFLIETGYRDKHKFNPRTCSRHASVRILLFVISCLLWNLWQKFIHQAQRARKKFVSHKNAWKNTIFTLCMFWTIKILGKTDLLLGKEVFL